MTRGGEHVEAGEGDQVGSRRTSEIDGFVGRHLGEDDRELAAGDERRARVDALARA